MIGFECVILGKTAVRLAMITEKHREARKEFYSLTNNLHLNIIS